VRKCLEAVESLPASTLTPSACQTIQDVLQQRWGRISHFKPLAEGLDSQAFCFRQGTIDYVLRINRSIDGFRKDRFVYRRFANPNLPIPEVLDVGRLDETHAFCVSRRMRGLRLQEMDATRLPQLIGPGLRLLRTIAAVDIGKTQGFGRFDAEGVAPYARWQDFLTSINDPQQYDWAKSDRTDHLPTVRSLCGIVTQLAADCPEERRLVHGDFGSCNVLTDGEKITAVIDWDRALFGDPLYDTANMLFWREEYLRPLLERIAKQAQNLPNWHNRVFCYQLRIGLQELYDSASGIGTIDLTWLTNRCKTIVRERALLERNC
jgi:hygromycin-B 4-O-kinase